MKTLYLLRHAKSSWKDASLSDDQRPLNSRGKRNAPEMASRLVKRGETLERILSSPAERARATARAFANATGSGDPQVYELDSLYFGGPSAFSQAIRQHGGDSSSLMLVSHNPDITAFANQLDDALFMHNLPTSGLLMYSCTTDTWADWSPACCQFVYYDYPKNPIEKPVTHPGLDA